jgi:soluble lytic murein transglycosylase
MVVVFAACSATERPTPSGPRPVAVEPVPRVARGATAAETFAIGYRLIQQRDHAQVRALLESIRDYEPLRDYVLFYLGVACARSGAAAQALALWTELVEQYPQSLLAAEGSLELGRLYRSQGDTSRAQAAFLQARNSGERAVAHAARLELADLDLDAGRIEIAAEELAALRRAAPGSSSGRKAKARLADLRERHPELRPHGAALEDELEVLLEERDYANAVLVAEQLIAVAPSSDLPALMRRKADAEYGAGRLNDAFTTLDTLVARFPRSAAAPAALFRVASLRWNKDFNDDARRSFEQMRRQYPDHPSSADALYALARIAYGTGDRTRALQLFEQLIREYPRHKLTREARWRIGWIHYEQGAWASAAAAFERTRQAAGGDALDASYWRGRAVERGGDREEARAIYRRILEESSASYYGLWAEQRLGQRTESPTGVRPARRSELGDAPSGAINDFHLQRARALHAGGLSIIAGDELRAFEEGNEGTSGLPRYLVDAYLATNRYKDAARVQRAAGIDDPEVAYPLAYWEQLTRQTRETSLDPLLVLALMRQESLYDPRALSPANARGLLQLLPATASATAGRPVSNEELFDPEINLEIGVAHLRDLMRRYDGDVFKTLAAYNGGPDAVAKWERLFPGVERDEFVESITYRETRDYVKKVLSHYRRYQQLYGA